MGKAQKPLNYLVHPSLADTPEVKERISKGHVITIDDVFLNYDVVMGPNCFRLSKETAYLIELAEKAARQEKYGTSKKEAKK